MTKFAGEEYLITHIALGFHDEPLAAGDVTGVRITVYSAGVAVAGLDNVAMTWDPTPAWSIRVGNRTVTGQGWWQYLWDTAGVAAGNYKAKVILTGAAGGHSIEYLKIRLARDPLPIT